MKGVRRVNVWVARVVAGDPAAVVTEARWASECEARAYVERFTSGRTRFGPVPGRVVATVQPGVTRVVWSRAGTPVELVEAVAAAVVAVVESGGRVTGWAAAA